MVEEISVRKIPVKDIIFDDTNPNELTDEQMEALKETMEKFGYLAPVVLNKNLFEVKSNEIRYVKPTAVLMEGKLVHGQLER